jgi:DNA ligase-1
LPFCLAHPLEGPPDGLGPREQWQAEWKWDGVRAQLVIGGGTCTLWSRGEELIGEQFPEILEAASGVRGQAVLDGELVVWPADAARPAPFSVLQTRLGRKLPGTRLRQDAPVVMLAFDVLAADGTDLRTWRLRERRAALEQRLGASTPLRVAPILAGRDWNALAAARAAARSHGAEGIMLKRLDGPYAAGRTRGNWWKWKSVPHTADAVLMYAQAGSGRRASLYTDYTFGVWHADSLVAFAKAYSGLTDAEIQELDQWIRAHTVEKFGPVRSVAPEQVFELAFEGIQRSSRHKSGLAVRFPRIVRWRRDKRPTDADRLESLVALAERTAGAAFDDPA